MTNGTPAISLILAAYNRERYVGAAIQSILAQTRHDFELIVWDDGSTDDTLAAARDAAGDDPRVRFFTGENQGFTRTINRAAALARGAYFGWVDSDDLLAPAALAETAAVLDAEPAVGMAYTSYTVIDATGKVRGPGKRCQIPYSPQRLLVDFMTFHFRLMRKALFDQAGGVDESLPSAQDYDLCLKLSEITEIRHIDKSLYFYRVHGDSISQVDRVQQIYDSRDAIRAALKRRKMDDQFDLRVEIVGKFSLVKKAGSSSAAALAAPEEDVSSSAPRSEDTSSRGER